MNVLLAGDFCPQYRVAEKIDNEEYSIVLNNIIDIVKAFDYSVVNLECPVTYGGEHPIAKFGPNLQCAEKCLDALKWTGFKCLTLANNHILDYGEEGVKNTLSSCSKRGIDYVGAGNNLSEASEVLYKEINGQRLAIINCCEHEFSIATEKSAGANPINPIQQYYVIKEAKKNSDFVLVVVHGGHEHYQLPSPRMQETYRFFIDAGADAVVNHHQHCYSGYEIYKNKPIFYGLGNFCFDREIHEKSIWNEGFMVSLQFGREVNFELYPYVQCTVVPKILIMNSDEKKSFDKRLLYLNKIISSPSELAYEFEKWASESQKMMELLFEPYNNRILRGLYIRKMLPSFINKIKKLQVINYINCEAHLDKLKYCIRSL